MQPKETVVSIPPFPHGEHPSISTNGVVGNGHLRTSSNNSTRAPVCFGDDCAVPMADQKAETIARAFIDNVVSRHGVPVKLLTDQGRNFESELMKEVFKLLGVHKLRTSPYHPQTDGQVERFNRTLKAIISSYVNGHHNDWDLRLPLALFAYRTSVHSSTRVSPFKAVYGRDATTPLVLLGSTEKPKARLIADYFAELEFTLKEVHATVAEKIKKAQTQQKQNYDARNTAHQEEILRPGDIVWLHNTVIPKGRSPQTVDWSVRHTPLSRTFKLCDSSKIGKKKELLCAPQSTQAGTESDG